MIAYTTIGTNDWDQASAYYDALFETVGAKPMFQTERFKGYGHDMGQPFFAICKPFNEAPATAGNGSMVTIGCKSEAQVRAIHAKACELGGTCDGEPGGRADGAYYMAYARDLDGNKLAFFARPGT